MARLVDVVILTKLKTSAMKSSDFFDDEKYKDAFEALYLYARKHGLRLIRSSLWWYGKKSHVFQKGYAFDGKKWVRVENIKPNLIYDLASFSFESYLLKQKIARHYLFVNDLDFTFFMVDKLNQYLIFRTLMKRTYKAANYQEADTVAKRLRSNWIVAKGFVGFGGENINIIHKDDWEKKRKDLKYPCLMQEFINSSRGIPEIVRGTHDLRFVLIGSKTIYASVRTPEEGKLLANVALGGTKIVIDFRKLNPDVRNIIIGAKRRLKIFGKELIYSVDMMRDREGKYWMVELNTMPGLYFEKRDHRTRERAFKAMVELFWRKIRGEARFYKL